MWRERDAWRLVAPVANVDGADRLVADVGH
jgi:hypothetical protein